MSEKPEQSQIKARFVIELAGFPKEHIEETLKLLVSKFGKEEGVKVLDYKMHEANQIGEKMWSNFTDLEFTVTRLSVLIGLIYDYMPSSVEILEPEENIIESTISLSEILNDLIAKLHLYDQSLKKMRAENVILYKQFIEPNLKAKEKTKIESKDKKEEQPTEIG